MAASLCFVPSGAAFAQALTTDLEVRRVQNVGAAWVSVPLSNSYAQAVVVCTYNLASNANPSAIPRIRNVTATSFEVRIQQFESNDTVTAGDVHCIVSDEGAYDLPNGLKYEARTVLSDRTAGNTAPGGWGYANNEEVTGSLTQTYANPVVLGQVMSFNDTRASAFWTYNCVTRGQPPFVATARICVGKHIGQINGARASETIGYIVAETGAGTLNDMVYRLARGGDSIRGVGNAPPYNYAVSDDYDIGVLSQNGEDGGQGGWAVLYGADPLAANTISAAIEEEVVAGDTSRSHTTEQVAYWVFRDAQQATVSAQKTIAMSSESPSVYALPGSDVLYTISIANTGSKAVDADTIFIADAVPSELAFYNDDIDGAGPEMGTVVFASTGSGLTFTESTDLKFSNAATKPASFGQCTYNPPTAGYDPNVTFICFNPKGAFNDGSFSTSEFSITFRAGIK